MDPISLIITAGLQLGSSVLDIIRQGRAERYDRLPDWLSPKDFQRQDNTVQYLLFGMMISFILIVCLTIWKAKK
ncbi:MAG: hypothetical protein AAF242_09820 [Bacteroidota bacterium]